ncbi:MAG: hypothetical protein U0V49_02100 [Saprospiraceae bacterium]
MESTSSTSYPNIVIILLLITIIILRFWPKNAEIEEVIQTLNGAKLTLDSSKNDINKSIKILNEANIQIAEFKSKNLNIDSLVSSLEKERKLFNKEFNSKRNIIEKEISDLKKLLPNGLTNVDSIK